MVPVKTFRREVRSVLAILLVGLGIGFILDAPGWGVALGLGVILSLWSYQLLRVQRWMLDPTVEPPKAGGIWGLFLDNIYAIQRRNREAQLRLESTLDYLQDSLAAMRDAAIIVDPHANVAWANDSADFLLGINFPSDQGQPLLNLISSIDFREYFETDDYSDPLRVLPEGDRGRCLQFEVARFGMGDRLVFARDVTRTFRLEQMRRDFVGNVSHELRTPLTVIKGYIETLQSLEEFSATRFQRPLEQMSQQALRMENLVTDLLWLSRIEAVETLRKTELIDVPALIVGIVAELQPAFPDRLIALNQESEAAIRGDERELHSALSNLGINALKYSDGDVRLRWWSTENSAMFSVSDMGIGIEPHHIARLTERFYRVDKSRSNAGGGTGLGLAIVKHVANSHQAELTIDSEVGVGSCFSLAFPFDAADTLQRLSYEENHS